jgi:hypothetical protein
MKGKVQKGHKVEDHAPHDIYAGANSEVAKEAKSKVEGFKRGGKAKKHAHHDMHVEGHAKHHAGRKPRKSGGQVMSSAHKGTMRPGFTG